MTWVAEMIKPVLNRSLSCNTSLEVKAEHCNHCETTVRNFLCLHLFQHCRILGIAQRIKIASRISHLIVSGSSPSLRGSNPTSPGRVPSRYGGGVEPGNQFPPNAFSSVACTWTLRIALLLLT